MTSVMFGLHSTSQTRQTASFPLSKPLPRSPCMIQSGTIFDVRYDLALFPCTIRSGAILMYDINLRATHTMILSIRGVTIPIYLVSSTTDSIRRRVVLFKSVPVPTSDPQSEFLCQSSFVVQNLQTPSNTSYTWEISHTLVTTYHPYCQSPSALTEYLKQRLRAQRAKQLGHSHSAQVKQDVPLERNNFTVWLVVLEAYSSDTQ